ncbi:3,4-dihydroxy-2-butanone 4-phosphate synthase / GTP cyclohydrolase II [hydrothermal vent metagenome]|uniref:3,4-dihydroxy-2-butanone 4-phosphate synthase / GTP cyclohydrolase II n=1 Tax=hydrothermal vent metagenome TaxID=652676 RepID=A0A3B1A5R0_9ZZZZ
MTSRLNTVEEIIEDIRLGKMVILMDDEDRENEGDLIMAAEKVTPEAVNFMAMYGRGLICLTMTKERCERLRLPLMVSSTNDRHGTNFTVSIEAAEGVTTGISAADRAATVLSAVAAEAKPSDLVQPGHIFPLMAQPGGVLTRAGHTEAGSDLARMAGLEPAAVIVEILNDDGSMARRPQLEEFAKKHGIKIGTVADLIHYRMHYEKSIERISVCDMPTRYGDFRLHSYRNVNDGVVHLALVKGEINRATPALVRVHVENPLCDAFANLRKDCSWSMNEALERIEQEGSGIVVLLRLLEDNELLTTQLKNYAAQDADEDLPHPESGADLRTFGLGAQILTDLGVRKMRVLSAPKKMHALSGFDLEVVEYINYRNEG